MDGVVRTRVGYSGGRKANPTYHSLGDHTETIQIDFDPDRISYRRLLDIFWDSHHCGSRPHSRQYKAAVFYHSEEQRKLAAETRSEMEKKSGKVYTEILPAGKFYLAEDYHQKYRLKMNAGLFRELAKIYPKSADLTASTAAARVNGYLAGYGSAESLKKIIGDLGLSQEGRTSLLKTVKNRRRW